MSRLELGFIVLVGTVVGAGSLLSLFVLVRAYFGGQKRVPRRTPDVDA